MRTYHQRGRARHLKVALEGCEGSFWLLAAVNSLQPVLLECGMHLIGELSCPNSRAVAPGGQLLEPVTGVASSQPGAPPGVSQSRSLQSSEVQGRAFRSKTYRCRSDIGSFDKPLTLCCGELRSGGHEPGWCHHPCRVPTSGEQRPRARTSTAVSACVASAEASSIQLAVRP